jgi:hypothetical protein
MRRGAVRVARQLDRRRIQLAHTLSGISVNFEFEPVRAEGVRLNQLGASGDKSEMNIGHRLRISQICPLRTRQIMVRLHEQRPGPAVANEDVSLNSFEKRFHSISRCGYNIQ